MLRRIAGMLASACAACAWLSAPARAVDPFEIQVYDGTANAPGVPGLELHVNRVFSGLRAVDAPLLAPNHQSHFTLEPSLGVTPFWELGAYLQSALLGDGSFEYAGVKLRSKFVSPEGWHEHLRIGLNFELSFVPRGFDPNGRGSEFRPIVAWETRRWLFAMNPIIEVPYGQPGWNEGPTFAPAALGLYKWRGRLAFGVEYYADVGAFSQGFSTWREQEHYLYEVVDVIGIPGVEVNVGIGEGLTKVSNAVVVKMILGYTWEPREAVQPCPRRVGGW